MADNSATWFLSDEALTKAGRVASLGIQAQTSENTVAQLIDASAYLKSLDELLASCGTSGVKGDYIFIASGHIDRDAVLAGDGSANTLGKRLGTAVSKGVEVRILMDPPINNANNPKSFEKDGVPYAFHDARRAPQGRQNQRFVVVHHGGKLVAYVGIELVTTERLDRPEHDNTLPRAPVRFLGGFHGVGVRLEGPAARDIDQVFRARWKDPAPINSIALDRFTNSPIQGVVPDPPESAYAGAGEHSVQVLLTFVRNKVGKSAAVKDVTGYLAWKRAIEAAESFIYIEDPYFTAGPIAELLADRLEKQPDLRVILVVPKVPDRDEASLAYWKSRVLANLQPSSAAWKSRFAVYHLEETKKRQAIHCDSCLMIIDDVWTGIGSMSMSRRGLTLDTELSIGIYHEPDDDSPSFAQSLRVALWREHLGLLGASSDDAAKDLVDIEKGFAAWASRAGAAGVHAAKHQPKGPLYDKGDYDKAPATYDRTDPSCEGTFRITTPEVRPSNEGLIEMNQRVAQKYLDAAKDGVFTMEAGGAEKLKERFESLAQAGSFLFDAEPPHTVKGKKLPHLSPVRVCMAEEVLNMMEALIDAARVKYNDNVEKHGSSKAVFGILSLARNPRYVPHGAEKGNHGLLLKQGSQMPTDKQGRTVEAVGRALDISFWDGQRLELRGYTALDTKYTTLKTNLIAAISSVLRALPTKTASGRSIDYDLGLPSVKEPESRLVDADGELIDSTVFIPREPVDPCGESGSSPSRTGLTKTLVLFGDRSRTLKLSFSVTGDMGWVYEDARAQMLAAIQANSGLNERIRLMFLDDNDHLHVDVRLPGEPLSKGSKEWLAWRTEGADLGKATGGT